jgi:hypothetical protein
MGAEGPSMPTAEREKLIRTVWADVGRPRWSEDLTREQWVEEQAQKKKIAAQPAAVPRWVLISIAAIIVVGLLAVIFIK